MVGPAAKREAVAHLQAVMGLSERRACSFVSADRKMIRYQSRRPPEAELRTRLRNLANERRRFGYRRLFILLRREGEASGEAGLLASRSKSVNLRNAANMRQIVSSATAAEFVPGMLHTVIPAASADLRSIESTPTPIC